MKAFGNGFKPFHDTSMGPSSGMSDGLGSESDKLRHAQVNEASQELHKLQGIRISEQKMSSEKGLPGQTRLWTGAQVVEDGPLVEIVG